MLIGLFSQKEEADPLVVEEETGSPLMVMVYGILASIFLTIENMANKQLSKGLNLDPKYGAIVGMCFLFVEGSMGTIALIVMTICGYGFYVMDWLSIVMMIIAAIFLYTSLVLLNYSIGIGLVGVAVSIFNSNAAIHTVIAYFALHQHITKGQVWGIVLSFLGICMLTMGDIVL